jgi:enoyl-CoA hydratase
VPDSKPVLYETEGPVAFVTINRPHVRNAVDNTTASALRAAFESIDRDGELRVAVLTGANGSFCAGFDLKAVAAGDVPETSPYGPMGPTRSTPGKPVIAAIEGYAVGGGLELALWCDLRVAARDSVLGVFNRRVGVPFIDGGTVRLPRLIGHGRALDMILTGRPVGAEEAAAFGLVDRVVAPGEALEAATRLALEIAAHPQAALLSDRRSVYESWGRDDSEALTNEARLGADALGSGEGVSGAKRFTAPPDS